MTLFEFMEDFDNAELSEYDRREQLEDSVRDYNEMYGTNHDPSKAYARYQSFQRTRYDEE